jgi:glycosyltransferase involved in cell wall biosynthesis
LSRRFYKVLLEFYSAETEEERVTLFWEVLNQLDSLGETYTFGNLCKDLQAWEIQVQLYNRYAPHESFIDFFWTTRFLHLPIWQLLRARDMIPQARVYHSITTGYAGFIGAIAARRSQVPFMLTEHGIYTNERLAEISRADWIYEADSYLFSYSEGLGKFKQIWVAFFFFLGRVAYQCADRIVSLFQGNAQMQIEYGADADKLQIIPNGIDPTLYDSALEKRLGRLAAFPKGHVVGFIGRVVTIKDVKTLIRAARIVVERAANTFFLIVGPNQEELGYYEDCKTMVEELGLSRNIEFLGNQVVFNILPKIDILVLTSVSEGLPLVILEAFAAAVPVVATDVGACRELVCGRSESDQRIGPAGIITRVSAPLETADALHHLILNPDQLQKMGRAGRARVEKFYTQQKVLDRYSEIYKAFQAQVGERTSEFAKNHGRDRI